MELAEQLKQHIIETLGKLNYIIHDEETHDTINYEIVVGSQSCWIQLEITEEFCVIQLYDHPEDATFHEMVDIYEMKDVSGDIEELIEHTKGKIKAEAKIESLIQKIYDICEEAQLNVDDYISLMHDFDIEEY